MLATFGPYFTQTDFPKAREKVPFLGGTALLVQGDINDYASLEIGLAHLNKAFYRDEGQNYLAEQTEMMAVTLGYRRWLSKYLSVAAAFSSSYTMGTPQMITASFAPGGELNTSASDITEYGIDLSVQTDLWSDGLWSLIGDLRYFHSFTNKVNEHGNHYGFILGVRYFIQGKEGEGRDIFENQNGN